MFVCMRMAQVIAKMPEVFNGDGCQMPANMPIDPSRLPLRKAAAVTLRCTPCSPVDLPHDPADFDKMCEIERANPCTLRVVLSIRCPPRELVVAQMLDLGTVPRSGPGSQLSSTEGGVDLIVAGSPVACQSGVLYQHLDAASPATFYARLTHSSVALSGTVVTASGPCVAHVADDSVFSRGGVLLSTGPPPTLLVKCTCAPLSGAVETNVSLTLLLVDHSSPHVTYVQRCSSRSGSDGGGDSGNGSDGSGGGSDGIGGGAITASSGGGGGSGGSSGSGSVSVSGSVIGSFSGSSASTSGSS